MLGYLVTMKLKNKYCYWKETKQKWRLILVNVLELPVVLLDGVNYLIFCGLFQEGQAWFAEFDKAV